MGLSSMPKSYSPQNAWKLRFRVQEEDATPPLSCPRSCSPGTFSLQVPLARLRPQVEARSWLGLKFLPSGCQPPALLPAGPTWAQ